MEIIFIRGFIKNGKYMEVEVKKLEVASRVTSQHGLACSQHPRPSTKNYPRQTRIIIEYCALHTFTYTYLGMRT